LSDADKSVNGVKAALEKMRKAAIEARQPVEMIDLAIEEISKDGTTTFEQVQNALN
jgi:hypothetical protein